LLGDRRPGGDHQYREARNRHRELADAGG
jgi:hypothetical protein